MVVNIKHRPQIVSGNPFRKVPTNQGLLHWGLLYILLFYNLIQERLLIEKTQS